MGELANKPAATDIVAQRVNYLLFLNGMSQRVLAMRLGVKPATVGNKMARTNRWNIDEILELADAFRVSTDYLLGREPIESAIPLNAAVPASSETGTKKLVAEAGIDPATSRL